MTTQFKNTASIPLHKNGIRAWLVLLTAASFMLLINNLTSLNVFTPYLKAELHFSPADIGLLFSAYFYGNLLFVFLAGIILECSSVRTVLLAAFLVADLSTLIFATTSSRLLLFCARFLLGLVGSFSMLVCVKIMQDWFTKIKIPLLTSVVTTYATAGALLAQTPTALVVERLGWRSGVWANLLLGILLTTAALCCLRNIPAASSGHLQNRLLQTWPAIKATVRNGQHWLVGIYFSLSSLPGLFYNANWGVEYLRTIKKLAVDKATLVISMNIIGATLGPLMLLGFRKRCRGKTILLAALSVELLLLGAIHWTRPQSFTLLIILFFLFGLTLSAPILVYQQLITQTEQRQTSIVIGFVSTLSALSGLYIYSIGWLITYQAQHDSSNIYTAANLALSCSILISLALLCLLKELHKI